MLAAYRFYPLACSTGTDGCAILQVLVSHQARFCQQINNILKLHFDNLKEKKKEKKPKKVAKRVAGSPTAAAKPAASTVPKK